MAQDIINLYYALNQFVMKNQVRINASKYLILILGMSLLSGCIKFFPNVMNADRNLNTIIVPEDFNWSLNTTVNLTVKLEKVGRSLGTIENRQLLLLDSNIIYII